MTYLTNVSIKGPVRLRRYFVSWTNGFCNNVSFWKPGISVQPPVAGFMIMISPSQNLRTCEEYVSQDCPF